MQLQHRQSFRVSYYETDGQGRVHHAQYINYFERGRVELLRKLGHSYRRFEADGLMLVVTEMSINYRNAARFDDVLELTTSVEKARGVRIGHQYQITLLESGGESHENDPQPGDLIVEATSTVACIDKDGRLRKLPEYLRGSTK